MIRATEFSPPLLHEVAALPALIGGYWHSERCESLQNGVWYKRQFQIYSGDKLWTGRWDYYDDPLCTTLLYAVTAAGNYVQRALRQRRHEEMDEQAFLDYFRSGINTSRRLFKRRSFQENDDAAGGTVQNDFYRNTGIGTSRRIARRETQSAKRQWRSLSESVYQFLYNTQSSLVQSRFAAMLRGHQQAHEITSRRTSSGWSTLSGTTELDLHVAESLLILGHDITTRCATKRVGLPLIVWSRICIPRKIESPSILGLRAKLSVNWNGQYILLLGSRDDNLWDAPLRQCAHLPPHNSDLRAHLQRSVGLRFGLLSSAISTSRISVWSLFPQILLWCAYYLAR